MRIAIVWALIAAVGIGLIAADASAQDKKEVKKDDKKPAPKKTTYTDAKEAGIDYVIQGEYVGKTETGAALGCQVIALGNGNFQAVVLPGGLPGVGWDGKNKILMDGTLDGEVASFLPTTGKWNSPGTLFEPGDVVTVEIADLSAPAKKQVISRKSFTVAADGTIAAGPPVGSVKIDGLDVQQAQKLILEKTKLPKGRVVLVVPARKYMAGSPKEFCATQKFPPVGQVDYKAAITKETMAGRDGEGKFFKLNKVTRKSPTLGASPPEGAIVLFDGKNADEWKEAKITKDGLLPVESNTKRKFGDFKLHIEFVSPFQPTARSQGRGNSGVYLHGQHEIQVLDSFGLAGLKDECGGFYTHKTGAPAVNMCYPPLTWQTYDVVFKSDPANPKKALVTVQHNGVVVHENKDFPAGRGHFHLQNHSNPVFYRNIWVVELK